MQIRSTITFFKRTSMSEQALVIVYILIYFIH